MAMLSKVMCSRYMDHRKNKNIASPVKPQLVHVDLIYEDGQMTIIVNMNNNMISFFNEHFSIGNNVQTIDFTIKTKTMYDSGDEKYCILLK